MAQAGNHLRDVPATRFDKVGYDLPNASPSALREPSTSEEDHAFMVEHGYSIFIEATLSKPGTRTTVIRWGLAAGTSFDDCAPEDGAAGFAVPTGATVQVKPTIHGDHWFFTNITQGAELTERRAQWIVDSDRNGDGETTLDELRETPAADVFPAALYHLSGSITPIQTAFDYALNQSRTLGDFQGHGECPTRALLP